MKFISTTIQFSQIAIIVNNGILNLSQNFLLTKSKFNLIVVLISVMFIIPHFASGQYCTPSPSSTDNQGITNISFNTINNTTGSESGYYGNYSYLIGNAQENDTLEVNITYSTGYTYNTKIWVDWNDDGDFDDEGEEVYEGISLSTNPTTLNTSFAIPPGAIAGNHRMRIGGNDAATPTPCSTASFGSYEDYTIKIFYPKQTDLAVSKFTKPNLSESQSPNAATVIGIEVYNPGLAPQSNFEIKYSTDNGANYISETYAGTLAVGDTINYIFTQTANLSIENFYNLIGTVVLANDSNSFNDTIFAETIVCTPLTGTYTVGIGKHFPNIATAINAVNSCGISGPVQLLIDSGTYDGSYELIPFWGSNYTNTLTLKGTGNNTILTNSHANSSNNFIFKLNGAKHVIIEDIKIESHSSNSSLLAFWLINAADSNIIRNCNINLLSKYNFFGILASSNNSYSSSGNNASNTLIENNIFNGGSNGVSLHGQGIDTLCENNIIRNNSFINQIETSIDLNYQGNTILSNNNLYNHIEYTNSQTGEGEGEGEEMSYMYGVNIKNYSKNILIKKNTIDFKNKSAIKIYNVGNYESDTTANIIVSNNMISIETTNYGDYFGIFNEECSYINYINNSIAINGSNGYSKVFSLGYNTSNIISYNNIFSCENGYLLSINSGVTNFISDYNNYYSNDTLLAYNAGTIHSNLSSWQSSSNNDFNSTTLNPYFTSTTNLHASNPLLNNLGTAISYVIDDIDNELRNDTTPDIGADEYTPSANDISLVEIFSDASNCRTTNESIYAVIGNYGTNDQTNFSINIIFNTSSNTNIVNTYTGILISGAKDTIFMGSIDGTVNQMYNIDAYTLLSSDQKTSNDSINLSFDNLSHHLISHIEEFEDYNINTTKYPWTLYSFFIQEGDSLGLTNNALAFNSNQAGWQNTAIFNEAIGIIDNSSELSFDLKFITNNDPSFTDTINFFVETCDGNRYTVFTVNNNNYFNDSLWHNYSTTFNTSLFGEVVNIGVDVFANTQQGFFIAIDNFGIKNPFDITLGNDTTICYGDSIELSSGLSSDSGFYSIWNGPSIFNDTTDNLMAITPGTYYLTVHDAAGNALSDNITISYTNPITATPTSDKSELCIGDSAFIEINFIGDYPLIVDWSYDAYTFSDTTYENMSDYFYPISNTDYIIHSVTDNNGCTIYNVDSVSIIVNTLPVISQSGYTSSYCTNDENDTIIASPAGGFFNGLGNETGIIDPSTITAGELQIRYSIIDNKGCSNTDTISTEIFNAPNAIISTVLNSSYCQTIDSIELFASPIGGTFTGSGIEGNLLVINEASTGLQEYIYSITDTNGCTSSDTIKTIINSSPVVAFNTALNNSYCKYGDTIVMDISPVGGQLIGSGVTGNTLYINASQSGNQDYIYNYTDMNGCYGSDTISTTIYNSPIVNITSTINNSYCQTIDSIVLSASPVGGIYSGSGLTANVIHLNSANTGIQTYSYSFTDNNGCIAADSIFTEINPLPIVSITNISDICANQNTMLLSGGTPAGGSYYGAAVATSSSQFYPLIAGIGNHNIDYTFTDNNGCMASANTNIKVVSVPSADFTIDASICKADTATINYNSTAGATASFNWTFDNGTIASGSDEGPYEITYDVAGIKNLSLTVIDSGCTSTTFQNYTNVLEAISVSNLIGNDSACFGENVILFTNSGLTNSYQWFDTSGNITSANDTLSYFMATSSGKYFVENTNANGCSAISNALSVTINPEILSTFSMPIVACRDNMVNINYNGTSSTTAIYNWNFDGGIIASGSNAGPFNIIWQTDSIKNVSLLVQENGCASNLNENFISIETTPAVITALGNLNFCNGGSVSLSANAGPYSYKWFKNGINTNSTQAIFSATESGAYTVEVTNNNTSCVNLSDSVIVTVNTDDFNIAFTANQTTFNIPPFNMNINNETANANDYYWMWSFGDGNSSTFVNPSHQYNFDGDYTIAVIAQNVNTGCIDSLSKTDYISCDGGSADPCNLDASFGNIGGSHICAGDSVKFYAYDHTTDVTYQWLKDGIIIAGATDSIFYGKVTGLYQLLIVDTICSEFSQPFSLTQYTTITPSILVNGYIQPCTNDSMELFVSTSFNSYQWSNGELSPNIFIKTSGVYSVTITDNNGCSSSSDPLVVNASLLEIPNICIVGIDSATNLNRVIWEREDNNMIDSFRIYRESNVANVYDQIGSQAFSDLSVFTDVNSNPEQMAYRYRITAIDTCGMETAPSPIHKTLHLTINAGLGGVWNLIWTNYEGFNFGSYKIYRSSDSTDMQLLTQIQSNLTSYTDLNPPTGNVYYQIEIIAPHQCHPDSLFSKVNTNYNTSRSNTANTATAVNIGIYSHQKTNVDAKIYPNPNTGLFTFEIGDIGNSKINLSILNTLGMEVYNSKFTTSGSSTTKQIDLQNLAKGVYIIRLNTIEGIVYRGKVIIN